MEETMVAEEPKIGGVDKYKVENAADTLVRAEEIKRDKKLLAAARTVINKKLIATQAAKLKATQAAGLNKQ